MLNMMRQPGFAYTHAAENLMRHLIETQAIESYSITPSLVMQTRDSPSDLVDGTGSTWKESLQDSTLDRVASCDTTILPC